MQPQIWQRNGVNMLHIGRKMKTIIEDIRKIAEKAEKNVPRLTALLSFTCGFLYMWLVVIFSDLLCLCWLFCLLIAQRRLIKSLSLWNCQFLPLILFPPPACILNLLLLIYIFMIIILPHALTVLLKWTIPLYLW